jgi:hypothetical protein
MKKIIYLFTINITLYILLFLPFESYASIRAADYKNYEKIDSILDEVVCYGEILLGKPYRHKLPSGEILDCSGFVQHIFQENSIKLPRTSYAMSLNVQKINLNQVQKGDLLFFTGRNSKSKTVGHVSIVSENYLAGIKMIHACNRGVVVDDFPRSYYEERFLFAGRVAEASEIYQTKYDSIIIDKNEIKRNDTLVSIIGVGDIMLGTNFPSSKYLPPNDGKDMLTSLKPILEDADVTFGNLEGVILTGDGTVKKCSNPEYCYAFKSPDHYLTYIKEAGFDVLSIANNHVGDFGDIGRKNTVKRLEEEDLVFAGLNEYPYQTFEKDSIKYGFCAFSPNTGTVRITDIARAVKIVSHLDSICDIVIISFHGGAEGSEYRNITKKTEYYLGENRGNPYEFSRKVIDAGADIVFGHGPHVTRALDMYKDRFIIYSLGNFATYGRFNLRGVNGIAPIIKVFTDKNGEFQSAQIIPIKQTGEGGPKLDSEKAVITELINLTENDIPNCPLLIKEDGSVIRK